MQLRHFACALAAAGFFAACAREAAAADPQGQFGVRGAALVSCEVYETERNARSEAYSMIASWMDGYITATNQHSADTYDVASFESTELAAALVSEYCKQHPDTLVFAVVNALVEQFRGNRLLAPSEKVVVTGNDQSVALYKELVKRVQEKMAAAGFYEGEADGDYNDQTREAMAAYQRSIDFDPTGFPDQLTLWRLFTDK
jgi:alkanesulfonate monooxygenase SsuD/methylene tetrahydromethanopterin reductase-like flavin-dependent oxidoreductase (luciferase family)